MIEQLLKISGVGFQPAGFNSRSGSLCHNRRHSIRIGRASVQVLRGIDEDRIGDVVEP